jgi:hypothetical protein
VTEAPVETSTPAPSDPRPWWRWVTPVGLTLAAGVAFAFMRPDLILQANTPTGGDMGAHVLVPAYLRDELLPSGRILGWSNDWYAGFPAFYFYFPLPALAIVALDLVIPYGVAFKLVTVAGLVALPFASYFFARSLGFSRPISLVGGVAGGTFVFMESFTIYGGNTLSTLAGEYSFSWSFALSIVYLGMVIRNVRAGRRFTVGSAAVLALAALSHIITTFVVVLASLPLLVRRTGPSNLVSSWGLGFAFAGFWAVPLLARLDMSSDMGWQPVRGWGPVFPRELWPMLVLAAVGVVWALARRYPIGPVIALMVIPVAGYFIIQYIGFTKLYNARVLGYWYYAVYLFAGLGLGAALVSAARRMRRSESARWTAAALGAGLMLVIGAVGVYRTPGWAAWNYSGYEGKQSYGTDAEGNEVLVADHWADYQALMESLSTLPPGRVMWEANSQLNRYGTPMALMLTSYWTDGTHPSMEGLLFESSITTPFHFLNAAEVSQRPSNPVSGLRYHRLDFSRAVPHLLMYNVAYYVSFTDEATRAAEDHGLELLAESPPFTVFALPESSLVDVAGHEPSVWVGEGPFMEAALDWYDDVFGMDRWLVADGPEAWVRIDDLSRRSIAPAIASQGEVTNVVLESHRISFDTTAVGVPHMVKVSYFPNWKATGADGPYRAAPSLMIVVPTDEHVVLTFGDTWAELLGRALTIGSIGTVAAMWAWRRWRPSGTDSSAEFSAAENHVTPVP